jgi:hypothetical protein
MARISPPYQCGITEKHREDDQHEQGAGIDEFIPNVGQQSNTHQQLGYYHQPGEEESSIQLQHIE